MISDLKFGIVVIFGMNSVSISAGFHKLSLFPIILQYTWKNICKMAKSLVAWEGWLNAISRKKYPFNPETLTPTIIYSHYSGS